MDRHIWFSLLLFTGLGLLWNMVGVSVALRNAVKFGGDGNGGRRQSGMDKRDVDNVLGPLGICLWGTLSSELGGRVRNGVIKGRALIPFRMAGGIMSNKGGLSDFFHLKI